MTVYLINIFLILFWGYIFLSKNKTDKSVKIYCAIVSLQWILISGLRHVSIGADTDAYYQSFEEVKRVSWSRIFSDIGDYLFNGLDIKDPGYALFQKIFQIFCGNYQVYLLFIAAIFTTLMAIWIYKNSSMPTFSFVLYSVLFYAFYAITGHRQTIATALIVFWGYKYIKERKLVKFLIIAFIAFMIHKSSLVFVPFYFIANMPVTAPNVSIALIFIAVIVALGKTIYGVVAGWLGFGEGMIEYDVGGAETYAALLTAVCIIVLLFYYFYKDRTDKATHIFNVTLITLMSSLLVFQNQSFMRVQQYYSLFLMMSFPEVLLSFDKKGRVGVYALTLAVLLFYIIRNNPQYLFFWQV